MLLLGMKTVMPTMDAEHLLCRRVGTKDGHDHMGRSFFNYDETFFGGIANSPEKDLRMAMAASENDLQEFLERTKKLQQIPDWSAVAAFDEVSHDELLTDELPSSVAEHTIFYMEGIPPQLVDMSSSNGSMDLDVLNEDGIDDSEINVVDVEDTTDGTSASIMLLQQDEVSSMKAFSVLQGPKQKRTYPCPKELCGKVFTSNNGLRYHLDRGHRAQPQKDLRCPYPSCDKSYRSRPGLQYHIKQVHDPRSPRPQENMVTDNILESLPSPMSTTFNYAL